jgi:ASC-1-like (ASCH) protein
MNLTPSPFKMIREGRKTIELRLYDEKRKAISIGDTITFCNTEEDIDTASPEDMEEYYSKEKQAQYGVVGIKITLI